jgi:hypothetical protein
MGKETLRDGKWFPEFILSDLVTTGKLSDRRVGYDIKDRASRRFFYDKKPFALLAWKCDDYAIVAFAPEIPKDDANEIVRAFVRIFGYVPFVAYETFQNNEYFTMYEWAKNDSHLKMIEIMSLPGTRDVQKVGDTYMAILKEA